MFRYKTSYYNWHVSQSLPTSPVSAFSATLLMLISRTRRVTVSASIQWAQLMHISTKSNVNYSIKVISYMFVTVTNPNQQQIASPHSLIFFLCLLVCTIWPQKSMSECKKWWWLSAFEAFNTFSITNVLSHPNISLGMMVSEPCHTMFHVCIVSALLVKEL